MRKILKLIKNIEGQSLVEAALVLSFVLIPLILGMVEFGWILNGKITITSAAREGARAAVVNNITPAEALTDAQDAVIKSTANSSLTEVTTTVDTFDLTTEDKDAVITVKAKIKPIVGLFFHSDVSLSATAKMRIE